MTTKTGKIDRILGIARAPVSHAEKWISALGGLIAILAIIIVSGWFVGAGDSAMIVASMGASAVLLFAVPHGPLSQPWPVLGGHVVSAAIGVTCARYVGGEWLAAGLAVGAAIGAMYYLGCIHPPGGATALSAVIGGGAVHELGYWFLLTPVLTNVAVILAVALLFNALFPSRRYPAGLFQAKPGPVPAAIEGYPAISHEDFVYALSEIDSFIDIDEDDLLRIYDLATRGSRAR